MKKIMLLYPPGKLYQRGEDRSQGNIDDSSATAMRACNDLGYAAAVLRNRGYDVFLRDYQTERVSEEDLFRDLEEQNMGMFVLSVTNATIYEDIALANRVREKYDCVIVLKGAIFYDAEDAMLDLLDLSHIDFLIGGEMDFAIGEIADYVYAGKGNLQDIDSIYYKTKDHTWEKTRFHVWGQDLDAQPFPARDLMKNELYVRPDTGEAMATIQTSRGCPSNCIYCLSPDISGKKVRFRSPENVFAEIKECYEVHGIKNFFFKADTFTIDAEWVNKLCNIIIQSDLYKKIEFTANSRVRPLKKETLEIMKKAGCFAVAFGFESGCQDTLDRIKKGTTVEENLQAMKWAKEVKLQVYGFYMIGFPWETREMVMKTVDHMFALDADFVEIHIALPYYGTRLYEECRDAGTLVKDTFGSDYFHSSTVGTQYVSMEELVQIRNHAMKKYYMRIGYICRKMIHAITKPVVMKNYVKYGLKMLKHLTK